MAALNAVDSTGVSQNVIGRVKDWRDWLENEDDSRQRYCLYNPFDHNVSRRHAEYIVQSLQAHLPLESNPQKTTVMHLYGNVLSDEALVVFCDFLRETSCHLVAVKLCEVPRQQFRRLLESLHTNTSVKELYIDSIEDDQRAVWVSNLLRHKTHLTYLRLTFCSFRIANLVPGLRRRHAHLQTLVFHDCSIGDEGIRLIFGIIGDANSFPSLKELDLSYNSITSDGLRSLADRGPVELRRLLNLNLCYNRHLFDDLESTGYFIQNMLVSDDMNLKDLHITADGEHAPAIIAACEHDNCKLQKLDISSLTSRCYSQRILSQLIESIPKMHKLEHLISNSELFTGDEQPSLLAAFQQNTSLVELTIIYPPNAETRRLFEPFLNRNQFLRHADSLMALQPKTHMPIGSKSGIWYMAFAKMGRQFDDEDETQSDDEEEENDDTDDSSDDNATSVEEQASDEDQVLQGGGGDVDNGRSANNVVYTGASAIFKILQKRPAILEKQLRRPAAAAPHDQESTGEQKDANGGRKRQRL